MTIPVSSPLGFIGLFLLGFGLFLVLAGFDIFTIQQVSVKKGPKTWGLGIGILVIGAVMIFPEITNHLNAANQPPLTRSADQSEDSTNSDQSSQSLDQAGQSQDAETGDWRPFSFNIPNDGIWSQPTENSYFASGGQTDSIAWADEIVSGDFTLKLDVTSDFGNYGEGMVIVYGEGQTWSMGCLIFNITGYWQAVRIDTIYGDDSWLAYNENKLFNDTYTMTIEVSGEVAKIYADDMLVASIVIPANANRSGQIGLVKYWESADVTFSNIQILVP